MLYEMVAIAGLGLIGSFYAAFCHESDTSLWQVVFAVVSHHYQLLLVLTLFQKPSPRYDFSLPKVFSGYLDGLPYILIYNEKDVYALLDLLISWAAEWQMTFNPKKTEF